MSKIKVLHLGCAHDSNDPRIRKKECVTLYQAGYDVVYMTSYQSFHDEDQSGQNHDGVVLKSGDYDRRGVLVTRDALSFIKYRIKNKKKITEQIISEKPDILHIHELELMYVVNSVRRKIPNVKVIFDVHEDYPGSYYDVFTENTIKTLAYLARLFIFMRLKKYLQISDAVITVTPTIMQTLERYKTGVVLICNFPILNLHLNSSHHVRKKPQICYCGLMNERRGIGTLLECADQIHAEIHLAGPCGDTSVYNLIESVNKKTNSVKYFGIVPQEDIWNIYGDSVAGICCYKQTKNNYYAYPTKIFEYMMAGIPVVCSDFPAWKEIVENNHCGLLVDPDNKDEIIKAINTLIDDVDLASELGRNGKKIIEEKYSWEREAEKLLRLYEGLTR